MAKSLQVQISTLDVFLNAAPGGQALGRPVADSAAALVSILKTVATEQVENETDEDSPWSINPQDSRKTVTRKLQLRERRIDDLTFEGTMRMEQVAMEAQAQAAMAIDQSNGLDIDGQYEELEERLGNIIPEDTSSSGSARQIAAFVRDTSRTWLEVGIPVENIAACNRPGKTRMLADISATANKVEQSRTMWVDGKQIEMTPEVRTEEHTWICKTARTVEHGQDFMEAVKRRYHDPEKPPDPKIKYEIENVPRGTVIRMGAEMTPDLWQIVRSRLGHKMERAEPGTIYVGISPHTVESALGRGEEWTPAGVQLMRIALQSYYPRWLALGILEANEDKWVDLDFAQTAAQGRASRNALQDALNELCLLHRDGLTFFADKEQLPGEPTKWRLA